MRAHAQRITPCLGDYAPRAPEGSSGARTGRSRELTSGARAARGQPPQPERRNDHESDAEGFHDQP